MSERERFVYVLSDVDHRPLYVGTTVNPKARIQWHRSQQAWGMDITHSFLVALGPVDLAEAHRTERATRAALRPLHEGQGITGTGDRHLRPDYVKESA
jgi:predicted GIY-YIG superfamily endonuclease